MLSGLSGLSGLSAVCGGAAAGPTAPAGAVFAAVAHPSCCRSDAANTVPCADGSEIRWWRDLVTGTWYEQATSGARFILRGAGDKWYAEAGAGRWHRFGWYPADGTSFSLAASVSDLGATTQGCLIGVSAFPTDLGLEYGFGATTLLADGANHVGHVVLRAWLVTGVPYASTCRMVYEYDTSGAVYTFVQNGTQISQLTGTGPYEITSGVRLSAGGSTTLLSGRIYSAAAVASIASGNRTALDAWMARYTP